MIILNYFKFLKLYCGCKICLLDGQNFNIGRYDQVHQRA